MFSFMNLAFTFWKWVVWDGVFISLLLAMSIHVVYIYNIDGCSAVLYRAEVQKVTYEHAVTEVVSFFHYGRRT